MFDAKRSKSFIISSKIVVKLCGTALAYIFIIFGRDI